MDINSVMIDLLYDFIEACFYLFFFCYITDKKGFIEKNKFRSAFFVTFFSIFVYMLNKLSPDFSFIFTNIFVILLASIVFKSGIFTSITGMTATTIVNLVYDIISISICCLVTGIKFTEVDISLMNKVIVGLSVKPLEAIISCILYFWFKSIFKFNFLKKESSFAIHTILQSFFILILVGSCFFFFKSSDQDLILAEIFILIVVPLYFLFNFLDYRERQNVLQTQNAFLVQKEYVKNLEVVIDIIRKEKHDFNNHINTLLAMCIIKKPDTVDKIEAYGRLLLGKIESSYKFYNTGNQYIDGLLAVKSNEAFNRKVHFDIDFDAPLSQISIDDIDLTAILGNIIDNALDAISDTPSLQDPVISVYSHSEDGRYYLSISNNAIPISQEHIEKIFERKFSTKHSDNRDRGFGLYITKELVEKNKGKISVISNETETEFLLEFAIK